MWKDTEKRFDDEFPKDRFTHCNCECMGCDAEQDRVDLKAFIRSEQEKLLQELEEEIEERYMNLELLNGAKVNGMFRRLNMKESIGWNKAIKEIQALLKRKY